MFVGANISWGGVAGPSIPLKSLQKEYALTLVSEQKKLHLILLASLLLFQSDLMSPSLLPQFCHIHSEVKAYEFDDSTNSFFSSIAMNSLLHYCCHCDCRSFQRRVQ
jgi:hypothetical protein